MTSSCLEWTITEHPLICVHLDKLEKGFIDENQGDEDGEDLLGKTRDEADEKTGLCRHHNQHDDNQPHSNPYTTHDVLVALRFTELTYGQTQTGQNFLDSYPEMIYTDLIFFYNNILLK